MRTLTKSWGFTALAVATLGIGLGANTALFSLVDALLLRSLAVSDPAGLVLVQRTAASGKGVPIDAGALQVILVAGLLIGLKTTDWAVVGVAAIAMLVAAALASILPALRAARVDPLTAIRSE
jgi:ABC-type antimicrobial peptide transport system permease subunit